MKKDLLKEIRIHLDGSYKFHHDGKPKKAIVENKKAMILCDRVMKVLKENDAIYETNIFLMVESSITRKKKSKDA